MTAEGIRFITNSNVGQEISAEELHKNNDAVSFKRKLKCFLMCHIYGITKIKQLIFF